MANDADNGGNNLPAQILFIDDDYTVGQTLEKPLSKYKIGLTNCQDLNAAMLHFNNDDYDVVFIELEFEELHGLALIQKLRNHESAEKRATSFVLISGKARPGSDDNLIKELLDVQLIVKPFSLIQVLPYLSRGVTAKQKLLKYELFRDKILEIASNGKVDQAIEAVTKNMAALGQKGVQLACEVYELGKQYEEGLAFIGPLADKERHMILYQYLKGRFLKLLGRFGEARSFLEEAYDSSPHHLRRLEDLGQVYLMINEPEQAVGMMKELVNLSPENPDMKFEMFKALLDKGFEEQAMKFCRETTEPMDVVRYYNNKGIELSKSGDIAGAIIEYERALKFFPNFKENYRIYYNIALAQIKVKNKESYEGAASNLTKCLTLNPAFDKAKKTQETLDKTLNKKAG